MTTLNKLVENAKNIDDNGIEMFLSDEHTTYSIDVTNNGDFITFRYYDNGIWAVEDDLQAHLHFTEAIDITIEDYINEFKEEGRKDKAKELKIILKKIKKEGIN